MRLKLDELIDGLLDGSLVRGSRKREQRLTRIVAAKGAAHLDAFELRIEMAAFLAQPFCRSVLAAYWRASRDEPARAVQFLAAQRSDVRKAALDGDPELAHLGQFAELCAQSSEVDEAARARHVLAWRNERARARALGGVHEVIDSVLIGRFVPPGCFTALEGVNEIVKFGPHALDALEDAIAHLEQRVGGVHVTELFVAYWLLTLDVPQRALAFLGAQPAHVREEARSAGSVVFERRTSFFVGPREHFAALPR